MKNISKGDIARVLVPLLVVVSFVAALVLFFPKENRAGPSPAERSQEVPAPRDNDSRPTSPAPIPSDTVDEAEFQDDIDACSKEGGEETNDQFEGDVILYETLRLLPMDKQDYISLSSIATPQYLESHTFDKESTDKEGYGAVVDESASYIDCQQVSSSVRDVTVGLMITTTRTLGDNTVEAVNGPFYVNEHTSRWILTDSGYKVDSE